MMMSFLRMPLLLYIPPPPIPVNMNINNTHTDSFAPATLKGVGTPWSFSRVIGGSFSFFFPWGTMTVTMRGRTRRKRREKESSERAKRQSASPLVSGPRMRMGVYLLPQTQTQYCLVPRQVRAGDWKEAGQA